MKRKTISFVLCITLVLTAMYAATIGAISTAAEVNSFSDKILEEELEGYRRITVEDIVIPTTGYRVMNQDDDGNDDVFTMKGGLTLGYSGSFGGKTYLDADINFNNSADSAYGLSWQGSGRYTDAFYIRMVNGQIVLAYYASNSALTQLCTTDSTFATSASTYSNIKLLTNVEKASASSVNETVTWQFWVNNCFLAEGTMEQPAHTRGIYTAGNGTTNYPTLMVPKTLSEELEGYTKVSFSDFLNGGGQATAVSGASAGTTVDTAFVFSQRYYQSKTVEADDSYSLDKTYFDFDLKTDDTTVPMIALYERENWYDYLKLTWQGDTLTATYVNNTTAGQSMNFNLADFGRASSSDFFNIKIRSDFSANREDASRRDASFQFWLNDRYAGEMNLTSTDLRNGLWVRVANSETIYIREPAVLLENSTEWGYDFWTFSHLGIADATQNTASNLNWGGISVGNSLDKTVFRAKINFPATASIGNWYIGCNANWFGFVIQANGTDKLNFYYNCQATGKFHNSNGNTGSTSTNGTQIAIFDPTVAGTTLRGNSNLDFALSVEYIRDDGNTVDLKVGVFFDGKLYNSQYLTVKDIPKAELAKSARLYNATYSIASAYGPKNMEAELEDYRRIDMFDYNKNITDGVASFAVSDTATAYFSDFDKTYLDVDVNYGGNSTWGSHMLQYQGSAKYKTAIYLGFNGTTKFRLTNYKNDNSQIGTIYEFDAADFGISPSEYFNIKLRTDIVAASATVDNVFVQLWLNDTFAFEGLLQFTYSTAGAHNKTYMGTASGALSVRSSTDANTHLAGYTRVVADDFEKLGASIAQNGTTYPSGVAGEYKGESLDQTYFDVDIKTLSGMNPFLVWLSKNKTETGFYGDGQQLRFYLSGTTLMMMKVVSGGNGGTVTLGDIAASPYDYSSSEFFNLKIKTDIFGANSVRLMVWVNNKFIKNIYVTNYDAETLENMTCAGIRGANAGSVTVARTPLNGEVYDDVSYNLSDGSYLLKGWDHFRVNGVVMNSGDVINAPGDYLIERLVNGEALSTQRVSLYRVGDVNLDGNAFVSGTPVYLDSHAAEGIVKYGSATKAAKLAADINNDGVVDQADIDLFTDVRSDVSRVPEKVDPYFGKSVSYDYIGGKNVMPISGFYGPDSADKVNDETFRLIAESGINIINYLPLSNNPDNLKDTLRSLALAEKYGLGMYLNDGSMNTLTVDANNDVTAHSYLSSASDLATAMSQYGAYQSYLGVHVYDEPRLKTGEDLDYSENYLGRYKYYEGLMEALKPYANIENYINLQGAGGFTPGVYKTFVESLVDDVKLLSFDAYLYFDEQEPIKTYKRNGYLETLDTMRAVSKENGVPFWAFVQAGTDYDKTNHATTGYYTEADTLWMVNTSLAFGAKGIEYFPLMQPIYFSGVTENTNDFDRNGLIGANGETTRYYSMVQKANTQIAAVDEVLMNADNKGVIAIGNAASEITAAGTQRDYTFESILEKTGGKYTDQLLNVTASGADGAMVGCFDYRGNEAYYVTNYSRTDGASQQIALTFDTNYDLKVIKDGVSYDCDASGYIQLTVDSGEGILVVLGDSNGIFIDADTSSYTLEENAVINGVNYTAGTVFTLCGDYDIVETNTYMSYAHTVVIYKKGDINADNAVDIRDLIRLKKHNVGLVDLSKSGNYAAQSLSGEGNAVRLASLRRLLLGT